jgi:steroid delta-isomerase-like uncharacterized protein
MGNPPTGNRVELSFLTLDIMDSNGKIKMRTVEFDNKAFEAQLMKGINPHALAEANIRKAYASLERHDFDTFASVCTDDFTERSDPESIVGVWNAVEYYKNFLNAFPDLKFTIESIVPAGNQTYYLKTVASGTNTGSFAGLPPTGKYVSVPDFDIITLNAEGKCTSHSSINHNGMITAIGYGSLANPSTGVVMYPAIEVGQTNAEMTRKVHDLFSKNQFDECVKFAAPDVQVVAHSIGMTFNGHTEFRNFMAGFKQAFPDMVITHNNSIALGDKIAVEFTATGTHTGSLQTPNGEIPASGKKVELKVCEFWEWKNGKITKITNYQDATSLMRQIASTQ